MTSEAGSRPAPRGSPAPLAARTEWADLTAQKLVRYEALFALLEEIQSLEEIEEIAQSVSKHWKYFANVASWRLVLEQRSGFLVADGYRGMG